MLCIHCSDIDSIYIGKQMSVWLYLKGCSSKSKSESLRPQTTGNVIEDWFALLLWSTLTVHPVVVTKCPFDTQYRYSFDILHIYYYRILFWEPVKNLIYTPIFKHRQNGYQINAYRTSCRGYQVVIKWVANGYWFCCGLPPIETYFLPVRKHIWQWMYGCPSCWAILLRLLSGGNIILISAKKLCSLNQQDFIGYDVVLIVQVVWCAVESRLSGYWPQVSWFAGENSSIYERSMTYLPRVIEREVFPAWGWKVWRSTC